jgi:hypothetical protein
VNVFPDEVCPYVNIVPLKPSSTDSNIGLAENSYTFNCWVFMSKILSKPNLYCFPSMDLTLTSELSKNSAHICVLS